MSEQARIVDVNLLPREQRPAQVSPLAAIFGVAVIVAIAALIPLSVQAAAARANARASQDRATAAESGLRDVQLTLARQRALGTQLQQAKDKLAATQKTRDQLQGGSRPLHDDFIWLYGLGFLTNGMTITAVTGTTGGFRVDGAAPGPLDAIAYAEKLKSSAGFPAARVISFTPGAKQGGQFSVEVTR